MGIGKLNLKLFGLHLRKFEMHQTQLNICTERWDHDVFLIRQIELNALVQLRLEAPVPLNRHFRCDALFET